MKKLIIAIVCVVVVVGAGFGMAKFNSSKAEQMFTEGLSDIAILKKLPFPVALESAEYESGLMSSTAKTRISIQGQTIAMLKHDISHGMTPGVSVVTTIDTEDEATQMMMREVPKNFSLKDVKIVTEAGAAGISNVLTIPAFGFEKRRESVEFGEMTLEVASDYAYEAVQGEFVFSHFKFQEHDASAVFEDLRLAFDSRKQDGVYLGNSSASMANMRIEDEGVVGFKFDSVKLEGGDGLSNGKYHSEMTIAGSGLQIQGEKFDRVQGRVSLNNVEARDLLKAMSDIDMLVSNNYRFQKSLEEGFLKVFSGSPELKLDSLEVVTPNGTMELTITTGLKDASIPERESRIDNNMEEFGYLKAEFSSPKKALYSFMWAMEALDRSGPQKMSESRKERVTRNVDRDLQRAVENSYLVEEGDNYVANVSLSRDSMEINGKDPLSEYRQRAFNSAAMSDLKNLRTACEAYYADYMQYPKDMSDLQSKVRVSFSNGVHCAYTGASDQQSYSLSSYHEKGTKVFASNSSSFEINETPR